ncbi:plasmid pRiA4b ORF-3 family protein [Patescibacteria group bacterium]|nr:plasmid pRiA4b ORF-3 family protein [Patescibacteria group bacterium]
MEKKFNQVYQFKISIDDINPLIWRQIQVPETYSFWDLHVAIQDVMPWQDYHLHRFEIVDPCTKMKVEIGIPDEEWMDTKELPGWEQKIAEYFSMENNSADYIYDFGDDWYHKIKLEKILARDKNINYPVCVAGERACPPEDCGGVCGYENLLQAIKNPKHEQHRELLEWIGGKFDPEFFEPKKIKFDNPDKRWKIAFK